MLRNPGEREREREREREKGRRREEKKKRERKKKGKEERSQQWRQPRCAANINECVNRRHSNCSVVLVLLLFRARNSQEALFSALFALVKTQRGRKIDSHEEDIDDSRRASRLLLNKKKKKFVCCYRVLFW